MANVLTRSASVSVSSKDGDGVNIPYIGDVGEKFREGKLPNVRETLQVFFYHHKVLKKTVSASAWATAGLVLPFWTEKSRIPVIQEVHIFEKIKGLFDKWVAVKKNHTRRGSDAQLRKEAEFMEQLDTLLDIAVSNALDLMTVQEDTDFLIAQRKPDRQGYITSVKDRKLAAKEEELAAKKARLEGRIERHKKFKANYESKQNSLDTVYLESASSSSEENDVEESDPGGPTEKGGKRQGRRRRTNVVTPEVAAACDALGLSSRGAAKIVAATVHSLGHSVNDFNVNPSSVHRRRANNRTLVAQRVKSEFNPDPRLTLLWDGKIVPDLTGKQTVDRIAVVVTGVTTEKMLAVPKIPTGTGRATADAVLAVLEDWDKCSKIKAFSFDTTSVNTGLINGASVLLEELLGHKTLQLACRHHVFEILLEAVYVHHLKPSGGPDILLFKRFQQVWPTIDTTRYTTGVADQEVLKAIGNDSDDIIQFAKEQVQRHQPRDDYLELLCLSIIFAGGVPLNGIKFMAPGAFNRARWMNKAIYSLKMWIFKDQFRLTKHEEKGLRFVNMFIVQVYLKCWFRAPDAVGAPKNDIDLIRDLRKWKTVDTPGATVALRKLSGHLWYLSETLVPISLFDERITVKDKKTFVHNLKNNQGLPDPPRRLPMLAEECEDMESLFTTNGMDFFQILDIPHSFLDADPATWWNNAEYQGAQEIVRSLRVVNDHAERAVKLMQNYNRRLTNKEEGFQDLLQVSSQFQSIMKGSKKPTPEQLDMFNNNK